MPKKPPKGRRPRGQGGSGRSAKRFGKEFKVVMLKGDKKVALFLLEHGGYYNLTAVPRPGKPAVAWVRMGVLPTRKMIFQINSLRVRPSVKRLGLGRALVAEAIELAIKNNCEFVRAIVDADNLGAKRFLEKFSFRGMKFRSKVEKSRLPDESDTIIFDCRVIQ